MLNRFGKLAFASIAVASTVLAGSYSALAAPQTQSNAYNGPAPIGGANFSITSATVAFSGNTMTVNLFTPYANTVGANGGEGVTVGGNTVYTGVGDLFISTPGTLGSTGPITPQFVAQSPFIGDGGNGLAVNGGGYGTVGSIQTAFVGTVGNSSTPFCTTSPCTIPGIGGVQFGAPSTVPHPIPVEASVGTSLGSDTVQVTSGEITFVITSTGGFNNLGPSFELMWEMTCANGVFVADFSNPEFSSSTPLPAALPLFASGVGFLGALNWRRKRKTATVATA